MLGKKNSRLLKKIKPETEEKIFNGKRKTKG